MTRRLWTLTSVLCILSLLISSCGVFGQGPVKREPLRVELTKWWGYYTLIIAQQKGYFKEYGVDVEPVYYDVFYNSLPDLADGQIDAALLSIGDALNVSRHADVKLVAIYDSGGTSTVIASPNIQSVSDLKGKRLGVPLGSTYELFVTQMLARNGLKASDLSLVDFDPEDIPGNLGVSIDAGYSWEPYTSEALANGNHVLFSSGPQDIFFPDVITFRSSVVQERPDDVRAFMNAWFEAVEFRKQNPVESRQIIANYFGISISEIESESADVIFGRSENQALFQKDVPTGTSNIYKITKDNADFLVRIGTLTKLPVYDTLIDGSFLQ